MQLPYLKNERLNLVSNWSSGYNVDVGYTYGFYPELSPNRLNLVALLNGVTSPTGKNLRYLELGCGFGVGLILLAAMYPDYEFLGVDFNPVHIAHGQKMANDAGLTNIRFEEVDFVELAKYWPAEWGRFNYVAAHGIYTWLAAPVRQAVGKTIEHATKPGALVYLSYNTMPGWASTLPLQHLLRYWQNTENLGSVTAITQGKKRLKALIDAKSGMTTALPKMSQRLESMESQDPAYLVHEYLNEGWQPIWFDQMVGDMAASKLNYVGTAALGDTVIEKILPEAQKAILDEYKNPIMREVMIDVMVNKAFRKDIFSRGATKMWPSMKEKCLLDLTLTILKKPKDGVYKFNISLGEVAGNAETYSAVADSLSTGPKTIKQLVEATGNPLNKISEVMTLLMHGGYVGLKNPIENKKPAKSLNRVIISEAANGAPYKYLVAADIGAVITVGDTDLIMAQEIIVDRNLKNSTDLAELLVLKLTSLNKGLVKDGERLLARDTMLPHAISLADTFLNETSVNWKKLGVF